MISIQHPPRTLLEVYRMLPEGTRAELIDNTLYMSPAPKPRHQKIVYSLTGQFYLLLAKKKVGELYISPIDVFLDSKNALQPDLIFMQKGSSAVVKEDGIYGAPDLIIEVMSPGSKSFDLNEKKNQYEKNGVREYWTVDSKTKICSGFQLQRGKYIALAKEKGKIISPLLKHTFNI